MKIFDILGTGEENAVTQVDIMSALDFPNTRSVRKEIERERLEGYLIMSSDAGYFLPSCFDELQQFVRMYDERLKKGTECVKPARDFLETIGEYDPQEFKNSMIQVGYKAPTDKGWENK